VSEDTTGFTTEDLEFYLNYVIWLIWEEAMRLYYPQFNRNAVEVQE
jgi:hypothetical protein